MLDTEIEKGLDESTRSPPSTSGQVDECHEPRKAANTTSWSLSLKIYHTAIPCFLAFLM